MSWSRHAYEGRRASTEPHGLGGCPAPTPQERRALELLVLAAGTAGPGFALGFCGPAVHLRGEDR